MNEYEYEYEYNFFCIYEKWINTFYSIWVNIVKYLWIWLQIFSISHSFLFCSTLKAWNYSVDTVRKIFCLRVWLKFGKRDYIKKKMETIADAFGECIK